MKGKTESVYKRQSWLDSVQFLEPKNGQAVQRNANTGQPNENQRGCFEYGQPQTQQNYAG